MGLCINLLCVMYQSSIHLPVCLSIYIYRWTRIHLWFPKSFLHFLQQISGALLFSLQAYELIRSVVLLCDIFVFRVYYLGCFLAHEDR